MTLNICSPINYPSELKSLQLEDPRKALIENYQELLKERVVVDSEGKEINGRLSELIQGAQEDTRKNQCEGEPLAKAVLRNALRRLSYSFRSATLGGLPTGPAYERKFPNAVAPQNFGHEKVGYPMSQYDSLSFLPVGGLGTPLCEIDYATCYLKEGFMVQDKPVRQLSVKINGKNYDLAKTKGTYYALFPFSERT